MDAVWSDLRFAVRTLRKSPGFTIVAILTLAIGIGANTAVFSVVNAVLLKPLPYPDPDRLVFLTQTSPRGSSPGTSPTKYQFWRERGTTVHSLAAFHFGVANLTGTDRPEQVGVAYVSAGFFSLFGARTVHGRAFLEAEDRPRGEHVAIVTQGLWHRRFGGDPAIVGQTVRLDGTPTTVVGILSGDFDGPAIGGLFANADVYVPLQLDLAENSNGNFFTAAARLAPQVDLAAARTEFQRLAVEFRGVYPSFLRPQDGFGVEPVQDLIVHGVRPTLFVFAGAVGLVLLIACTNIASLLMARATGREREIAIRAALGASRGRILQQLATESLLLSTAAGALGIFASVAAVRAVLAIDAAQLPRVGVNGAGVVVDLRVLAFTAFVSLTTGVVFGLLPAWRASRPDVAHAVGSDRLGPIGTRSRARSVLASVQTAIAVVLLVSALLLIRSFVALRVVNPGFDVQGVLTARMSLSEPRFSTTAAVNNLIADAVDRVRTVPGVVAAGASCCLPLQDAPALRVTIVGRPLDGAAFHVMAGWRMVSPGFFDVFEIPVVRGRRFTSADVQSGAPVVLINEAMAQRFWSGGDPLHAQLEVGKGLGPEFDDPPREVVGVVADVRDVGLTKQPIPTVYVPLAQLSDRLTALNFHMLPIVWVVRALTPPTAIAREVEDQLHRASAGVPITRVWTMPQVVARSTASFDFNTALMAGFAAVALVLAGTGIFGIVAYSVQQRRREIAIRVACGAGAADVRRLVVWGAMRPVLAGALVGIVGALGSTRLLAAWLFGVQARDAASFVTAPLLMAAVAMLAVLAPMRQALRVDPAVTLRGD